jgi:hypothetical protein
MCRMKTYKKHRNKKDDACNDGFCERLGPPSMTNLLPRYAQLTVTEHDFASVIRRP